MDLDRAQKITHDAEDKPDTHPEEASRLTPIARDASPDSFVRQCLRHLRELDTPVPEEAYSTEPDSMPPLFDTYQSYRPWGFYAAVKIMLAYQQMKAGNPTTESAMVEALPAYRKIEADCAALAKICQENRQPQERLRRENALRDDLRGIGYHPQMSKAIAAQVAGLFAGTGREIAR